MLLVAASVTVSAQGRDPCRRHENSEKKIALTFDDGPHGRYTEEILDILHEFGIKATFFTVGVNVESRPDVVKRTIAEGHEIGNHTYSHPHLTNIEGDELFAEMKRTEEVLERLVGYRTRLFRPPEGVYSKTVSATLERMDYIPILWTVDTEDWKKPSAKRIADTVMQQTESGVIILCHDFVSGKSNTPAALRIFLPKLLEQGYRFVTVSELLTSR
jgi:polysaccharide deacetylase family sporulation protein PdaB